MRFIAAACLIITLSDACQAQLFRRSNTRARSSSGVSSSGNVTGYTQDGKAIWTDYRGRHAYYANQCCSNPNCVMRQKIVAALNAKTMPLTSNASSRNASPKYLTKTEMQPQTYRVKVCRGGVCSYEARTRMVPVQVRVPVESKAEGDGMGLDLLIGEITTDKEAKAREAAMNEVKQENVPTPREVIKLIFDIWQLPKDAYLAEPCAGSAPFLREGVRRGYQGWGVEINPETARETSLALVGETVVLKGDVRDYDFSNADAVFLYAYRGEMEHVISTLKPGCRVASYQNKPPGVDCHEVRYDLANGETVTIYLGVKS